MKPLIIKSLMFLVFTFSPNISLAKDPTPKQFFNQIYSQAMYLEQCFARKIISESDVHEKNMRMSAKLGYPSDKFWKAIRNGAKGLVYEFLFEKWTQVPFDKTNCKFVLREQKKIFKALVRYF